MEEQLSGMFEEMAQEQLAELEAMARELLSKAEDMGLDSMSISWAKGEKQQERAYYWDRSDLETLGP